MTFRVSHEPGRGLQVEPLPLAGADLPAAFDAMLLSLREARDRAGRPNGIAALEVFADALARADADPEAPAPAVPGELLAAARDAARFCRERAGEAAEADAVLAAAEAFDGFAARLAEEPGPAEVRSAADLLAAAAELLERAGARPPAPPEEDGDERPL